MILVLYICTTILIICQSFHLLKIFLHQKAKCSDLFRKRFSNPVCSQMPKCELEFAAANGAKRKIEKNWKGWKKKELESVHTRKRFGGIVHYSKL